jgi:hypothetical protein
LTGYDNCNHAVVPGCKQYGKSHVFSLSDLDVQQDIRKLSQSRVRSTSRLKAPNERRVKADASSNEHPSSFEENLKQAFEFKELFSPRISNQNRRSKTRGIDEMITPRSKVLAEKLIEDDDIPDLTSDSDDSDDEENYFDVQDIISQKQSAVCCDCRDKRSTCAKQKAKCACRRAGRECS